MLCLPLALKCMLIQFFDALYCFNNMISRPFCFSVVVEVNTLMDVLLRIAGLPIETKYCQRCFVS